MNGTSSSRSSTSTLPIIPELSTLDDQDPSTLDHPIVDSQMWTVKILKVNIGPSTSAPSIIELSTLDGPDSSLLDHQ